jgi:hypothetical protein
VSDPQQLVLQMEHAEQRGDRRTARALAQTILSRGSSAGDTAPLPQADKPRDAAAAAPDVSARLSAEQLLRRTQPDAFLLVVGLLGLGVMVWLVYNYVL